MSRLPPVARHDKSHSTANHRRAAGQIIGVTLERWRETRQVVTFGSKSSAGRWANHRRAAGRWRETRQVVTFGSNL